jgi:hypothetical protein
LIRCGTLALLMMVAAAWLLPAPNVVAQSPELKPGDTFHFQLAVNPAVAKCLARFPDDANRPPTADVTVVKGKVNDMMTISLHNFKPGLSFDLFTVQRSPLQADGALDPGFKNFGFAWYQTDIDVDPFGEAFVEIKTVLLNEIFGFDPDGPVAPTPTFHVGLWFDDPKDAMSCGFDPAHPTPFNGEHKAGPLAMISLPDKTTSLGPLFIPEK